MKKVLIISAGVLNAVCIAAVIVCVIMGSSIKNMLLTQQAADIWKGDGDIRFTQLSAYFRPEESIPESTINSLRAKISTSLTEITLEAPEGGSLFTDAFSANGKVTLTRGNDQTDIRAYGIGGDFFLFHPLELLSGSYIWGSDLMKDRIVIDENVAWRFFGSSDVAGMEITVNGRVFLIAGVVRFETDRYSRRVIGDDPCVFVDYSVLAEQGTAQVGINSYELVMPNPITNFAMQIVRGTFISETIDVVENTYRYSSGHLNYLIRNFGSRSAENTGILYPYWENAARLSEDYAALTLFVRNVFLILPILTLATLAVLGVRFVYVRRLMYSGKVTGFFGDIIDKRRIRKYEEQQANGGKPASDSVSIKKVRRFGRRSGRSGE